MNVAHILIQHATVQLDKMFTYDCSDCSVQVGQRVEVFFAKQKIIGIVVQLETLTQYPNYELKKINRVLDEEPLLNDELLALGQQMAKESISTRISCYQAMLPPYLKIKDNRREGVKIPYLVFVKEIELKTPKQQLALAYMKELREVEKKSFVREFKSIALKVIQSGAVREELRLKEATLVTEVQQVAPTLTKNQELVIDEIKKSDKISLLHGVTGSGKTEIFLQLAEEVMRNGKEVIVLVPEISLTTQMIQRVRSRFQNEVAIYHSGLSPQEKLEQFQLVKQQNVKIIVGTRSSVFVPFKNIGLIIIDEEHDGSYKQESHPRYHTLDVVKWRANAHVAKVVLASATPSLESYARAKKGVYQLVELKQRINEKLPKIYLVNMQEELRKGCEFGLSTILLKKMEIALSRKEQVILLLNRRGYASQQRCLKCGEVAKCQKCEIPYHYHQSDHSLHCHYCGDEKELPRICEHCGGTQFSFIGLGTQRLCESLKKFFPTEEIIRMDYDTTRIKNAHEILLKKFERQEARILVGTQMIAKGLDFENVTLVGILNADDALQMPTFQASFKTFSLISQAAGRSGRAEKSGEVVIQAFNPNHYSIQDACHHNYIGFFKREMQFRHVANYPPYVYLLSIVLASKEEKYVEDMIQSMKNMIDHSNVTSIGPSKLGKRNDFYRRRILLKSKDSEYLRECGHALLQNFHHAKVRIEINMNPMDVE